MSRHSAVDLFWIEEMLRSNYRKTKIALAVGAISSLAALAITPFYELDWTYSPALMVTVENFGISIGTAGSAMTWATPGFEAFRVGAFPITPGPKWRWLPMGVRSASLGTFIIIPLWIPTVLFTLAFIYLNRKSRSVKPGQCSKCEYDLTGNVSGTCPECGAHVTGAVDS